MNPPYGVLYKTKLVTQVVLLLLRKIYCTLLKISDNRNVEEGKLVHEGSLLCLNCHRDFRFCFRWKIYSLTVRVSDNITM